MHKNIICADLGGTNSRFAHFTLKESELYLVAERSFLTQELCTDSAWQDILKQARACLSLSSEEVHFYLIGVAGPIASNGLSAQLTNAPLCLDFSVHSALARNENFLLVNDFALQAFASLAKSVKKQPITAHTTLGMPLYGTRAILGAGTGLGTAALIPISEDKWSILQAEGGHTDMTFYGADEQDFVAFATKYLGQERLSAEDVLAAQGLSLLHAYVHGTKVSPKDAAIEMLKAVGDKESLQLQLYARFLGRFCRQWALSTLSTGGLYLGGGVLMKNMKILQSSSFLSEFYNAPPKMQNIIHKIPIICMQHEHLSLWGAAYLARQHLMGERIF